MSKEKPLNIYQRIKAIMAEEDYIQKSEKKVANQYRFVSHDSVTALFHKQFVKHGVVVLPTVKTCRQDGNRTEVELEVKFVNCDEPTDFFTIMAIGYGIDTSDKGPGKAVSYAYKYALLKVFAMETGDDPDQDQNVQHEPQKATLNWDEYLAFVRSFGPEEKDFKIFADEICKIMKFSIEDFAMKALADKNHSLKKFNAWKKLREENITTE